MKILAVDDDEVFLGLLVPMLNSLGEFDVTTESSAIGALSQLQKSSEAFDCLLFDIQMPGMDGIELCKCVRQLSEYRRTPIVMITAMSTKKFIDDAFTGGATDYVTKPLDRHDLQARLGMVARLLEERRCSEGLARQFDQRADVLTVDVDFETAFMVPGFNRGIEYLALENYMLTMGMNKLTATAAIAIHIQNADIIFRKSNAGQFVNMLSDVASVIDDIIKTDPMMISYAGKGDFVGVVGKTPCRDYEELELAINLGLEEFESIYISERIPLPCVKVGPAVKNSLFASFNATMVLKRAIELAQVSRERPPRFRWKAA